MSVVHGCQIGDSNGDWVEATIHPGTQVIDPSQPETVQIGLAVSKNNDDTYLDDSGPVLVKFTGQPTTVRLAGPIHGAHVFLRELGSTAALNVVVPSACDHVAQTDLHLAQPAISRSDATASCGKSSASLGITLFNDGDTDADYTVLLLSDAGQIIGSDKQGKLETVLAHGQQHVDVVQPLTPTSNTYQFEVRVLAQDGQSVTGGNRSVQCDSRGQKGPRPSQSPIHPSQPPTTAPSSPAPSHQPSTSKPAPHSSAPVSTSAPGSIAPKPTRSATSTTNVPAGAGSPIVGSSSDSAGNAGSGDSGSQGSVDTGGAVLGDADSTRQPVQPQPSKPAQKRAIIEAAKNATGVGGGFAAGGALILLAFAGAIGGMVAANRASARRR